MQGCGAHFPPTHTILFFSVSRLIDVNRLPHLLFYGPPGTGKTTTILALAHKLYGPSYQSMVLELNASDDRGIDVVREQIKSFAGTRKLFSTGVKLIVLDEADAMTADAQFALRRVIEKYTRNTRFCLICNYVSKIIPALQSRCTRFRFAPLRKDDMEARMRYVVDKEGLGMRVTDDGLQAILRLSGGDMRKVLNVLQATASGFDRVDAANVHLCTGNPTPAEVRALLESLLNKPLSEAHKDLQTILQRGFALTDILNELSRIVPDIHMVPGALRLLVERMAEIEHRLAFGTSEKLQGASLVAAFWAAREVMGKTGGGGSQYDSLVGKSCIKFKLFSDSISRVALFYSRISIVTLIHHHYRLPIKCLGGEDSCGGCCHGWRCVFRKNVTRESSFTRNEKG